MLFESIVSTTNRTDEFKENIPVDVYDAEAVVLFFDIDDNNIRCFEKGDGEPKVGNRVGFSSLALLPSCKFPSQNSVKNSFLFSNNNEGVYMRQRQQITFTPFALNRELPPPPIKIV